MKNKPILKGKTTLDRMLENSSDKKSALKKIIRELEKAEIMRKDLIKIKGRDY